MRQRQGPGGYHPAGVHPPVRPSNNLDISTSITVGTLSEWLNMIQGKKVLAQVINSGCFQVQAADGIALSGREKINEIVKDLLKKDASIQPDDFVALKQLIDIRTNGLN